MIRPTSPGCTPLPSRRRRHSTSPLMGMRWKSSRGLEDDRLSEKHNRWTSCKPKRSFQKNEANKGTIAWGKPWRSGSKRKPNQPGTRSVVWSIFPVKPRFLWYSVFLTHRHTGKTTTSTRGFVLVGKKATGINHGIFLQDQTGLRQNTQKENSGYQRDHLMTYSLQYLTIPGFAFLVIFLSLGPFYLVPFGEDVWEDFFLRLLVAANPSIENPRKAGY